MANMYRDVKEFNEKVIKLNQVPCLTPERVEWFKRVINEELGEFEAATHEFESFRWRPVNPVTTDQEDEAAQIKLTADMYDAIIDLVYFALGRLYELGMTETEFEVFWNAVHTANMTKQRGNKGRGSDDDAIKPTGWVGPEQTFINYKKYMKELEKDEEALKAKKDMNKAPSFENNNKEEEAASVVDEMIKAVPANKNLKYDDTKPNLSLVFGGFQQALLDVGYIGTFGAKKYKPNSWKELDNFEERYTSALLRHVMAVIGPLGEVYDKESGHLHMAHAAWNALALTQHYFEKSPMVQEYFEKYIADCLICERQYFKNKEENK